MAAVSGAIVAATAGHSFLTLVVAQNDSNLATPAKMPPAEDIAASQDPATFATALAAIRSADPIFSVYVCRVFMAHETGKMVEVWVRWAWGRR